ncbi:MAG: hypothetical protein ACI9IP_002228 [Arcticibacterium sp.]|jgi:hypothetical protein
MYTRFPKVFLTIVLFFLMGQYLCYAQTLELEVCDECLESVIDKRFRVSNSKKGQKIAKGLNFKLEYYSSNDVEGLLYLADAQLIRIVHDKYSL